MHTAAWLALDPGELATLVFIWNRHNGRNNGEIGCGVRELEERFRCSRHTAIRWLGGLQDKGFIVATRRGSFNQKTGGGRTTRWRLTTEKCDGHQPTRDYLKWEGKPRRRTNHGCTESTNSGCTESTNIHGCTESTSIYKSLSYQDGRGNSESRGRAMTPELLEYLQRAANHKGPGILIGKRDRRIAAQAIAAGYGRATEAWFPLFVINERGRAVVAESGSRWT